MNAKNTKHKKTKQIDIVAEVDAACDELATISRMVDILIDLKERLEIKMIIIQDKLRNEK